MSKGNDWLYYCIQVENRNAANQRAIAALKKVSVFLNSWTKYNSSSLQNHTYFMKIGKDITFEEIYGPCHINRPVGSSIILMPILGDAFGILRLDPLMASDEGQPLQETKR